LIKKSIQIKEMAFFVSTGWHLGNQGAVRKAGIEWQTTGKAIASRLPF
jgi:hypothetical protein